MHLDLPRIAVEAEFEARQLLSPCSAGSWSSHAEGSRHDLDRQAYDQELLRKVYVATGHKYITNRSIRAPTPLQVPTTQLCKGHQYHILVVTEP